MATIEVEQLGRSFRQARRFDGPLGSIRTLLTREYTTRHALKDLTFSIEPGESVAYLGPNGAGKSTTIKMLSGILVPTSGSVQVAGYVPWEQREQNALQIGVVFGQRTQLWWDLPLADSLKLIARLYRVDDDRYKRNLAELVDLLDLSPFLDRPVRQLSLGQRMRGDLAAAMLYEPRILYLDEPTVGLDVVAKEKTRQFVEEINRDRGTTVILTTHDLADVERLCKRIIFIAQGTVLYDGSVAELKRRFAPWRELVVTRAAETIDTTPLTLNVAGAEVVEQTDALVKVRFDPSIIAVADLIQAVVAQGAVSDIAIVEPDLEGVVRRITENNGLLQ